MRIRERNISLHNWRNWIVLPVFLAGMLSVQAQITYELRSLDGQNQRFAKMHVVSRGETLYGLSRQYSVSVKDIKTWNGLRSDNLNIGQRLIIESPSAEPTTAASPAPIESAKPEESRGNHIAAQEDAAFEGHLSDLFRNPAQPENSGWTSEGPDETEWSPFGGGMNNRGMEEEAASNARTSLQPDSNPLMRSEAEAHNESNTDAPAVRTQQVYYQVKSGDDIYSIADKYKVRVDQLRAWNAIVEVMPGDVIVVSKRTISTEGSSPEPQSGVNMRGIPGRGQQSSPAATFRSQESRSASSNMVMRSDRDFLGRFMETGDYVPYEGEKVNSTRFYALHKTLPIGSTFKLMIPNNGGYFEVKVVGRLDNEKPAVAALSYDCIRLLQGSAKGDLATIYYD